MIYAQSLKYYERGKPMIYSKKMAPAAEAAANMIIEAYRSGVKQRIVDSLCESADRYMDSYVYGCDTCPHREACDAWTAALYEH